MIQFLAILAAPLLNLPVIRRIRRNHGLEHATIHMLSRKQKNLNIAGRSTSAGFYLYGNVPTAEVEAAVLTDLVPIAAYVDRGFGVYLKNSQQ